MFAVYRFHIFEPIIRLSSNVEPHMRRTWLSEFSTRWVRRDVWLNWVCPTEFRSTNMFYPIRLDRLEISCNFVCLMWISFGLGLMLPNFSTFIFPLNAFKEKCNDSEGPGKRWRIVAHDVSWARKRAGHKMNVVFPCFANWETFVADTKCFWTKSETFFVSQTQNLWPQQMLRVRANGETFVSATMCRQQCVGNNVSATMCPRLPGPIHSFSHECGAKDVWVLLFKFRRHLYKGTRLWEINPTNSVVIPQSLVLRSTVLGWILIYRDWFIVCS